MQRQSKVSIYYVKSTCWMEMISSDASVAKISRLNFSSGSQYCGEEETKGHSS